MIGRNQWPTMINNLIEALKLKLRVSHRRSTEEEARNILRTALAGGAQTPANLAEALRQRFAPFGGVDLPQVIRGHNT
jgi:antitoxin FitA